MIRTLIGGATMAGLLSLAVLAFAPNHALADESEGLSSAPVAPSLGIAEHGFQVAQGKKQGGGGGGGGKTCPAGYADCDGSKANKCETNIQTDVSNCGACGKVCSLLNATATCTNGTCGIASCATGTSDCDGNPSNGCEAQVGTDPNNCGSCGKVCSLPNATAACENGTCGIASCATGYADCDNNQSNGCESNIATDVNNCSACGKACGSKPNATRVCQNATCYNSCLTGYGNCDYDWSNGCETKLDTTLNCGFCGRVCTHYYANSSCPNGTCQMGTCNPGYGNCDGDTSNGCESKLNEDANNCGACGKVCGPYPNASAICVNGTCELFQCKGGAPSYRDCDGDKSNGCETQLLDDNNCGACGKVCSGPNTTGACVNGSCASCASGYANCDGSASNGCETNIGTDTKNCGACGSVCSLPNAISACTNGTCGIASCATFYCDCDGNPSNGCERKGLTDNCNIICSLQ